MPAESPNTVIPASKRVPEPYLRAEIAVFPIASEESFRHAIIKLDPLLKEPAQNQKNPTRELWRACESEYAQHTGWSLDRLVSARDLGWFGAHAVNQPVPMQQYLFRLARTHLMPRAGYTGLKAGTELSSLDIHDRYRWLTFSLPEDLLMAALGVDPVPRQVDFDPPLLVRRLLDLGVAEIHQHIGASMDFPLLWASSLAALASSDICEDGLVSPGAPMEEGKLLIRWLLAAAVARCAVAEQFIRRCGSFQGLLQSDFLKNPVWTFPRKETFFAVLRALMSGDAKHLPKFEPLRELYMDIHPSALRLDDKPLRSLDDAFRRCDPIALRLELNGNNAGERWFLRKSLGYLRSHAGQSDVLFQKVFWQTVRVRCLFYRTVVQRPLTGGLQWFIRFYERPGKLRKPLSPIMPEVSYHVDGVGHRIKSLEFRTTAADTAIENGEYCLEILKSWQRVLAKCGASFEPELGLVLHFAKSRDADKRWLKGVPPAYWANTHADPQKQFKSVADVERGRYVAYFAGQARKARAIAELIGAVPSILWLLRGLDIANDEMGIPTWVFVPLFRHVLDEAAKSSIYHNAGPPMRVTAHVGEDFRHLQEGLRRIYEQVHYLLGSAGGRLGHAVALGIEPRAWAESVGSILMPAEERLWDLVWEWRIYSKHRIRPEFGTAAPPGRMDALLNQARDLSERVFGCHKRHGIYSLPELAEAHHLLHRFLIPPIAPQTVIDLAFETFATKAKLSTMAGSRSGICSPDKVMAILEQYLDMEPVFNRGQNLVDVAIRSDDIDALLTLQNALRRGISQNGIVVEVNPSSNLLIGDLLDLRNHPILRLSPPVPEPDGPPPIPIAIGSDDPLTFSTRLLHEYSLLHQAALAAGYPERTVQAWLESIRQTGMDARFTKAWLPSAKDKAKALERDLAKYLHVA
jgi:hypothetical protein